MELVHVSLIVKTSNGFNQRMALLVQQFSAVKVFGGKFLECLMNCSPDEFPDHLRCWVLFERFDPPATPNHFVCPRVNDIHCECDFQKFANYRGRSITQIGIAISVPIERIVDMMTVSVLKFFYAILMFGS